MDQFEYVMALVSVVVGLGLTHILSALGAGVHRLRGHGAPIKLEPIYLLWVLSVLLLLVSFWWWEFKLQQTVTAWTFPVYLFVIVYAITFYLVAVILVPERLEGVDDSFAYFISVRHWLLGVLLSNQLIDIYDTALKGMDWLTRPTYIVQASIFCAIYVVGMLTKRRAVHLVFAIIYLAVNVLYILLDSNLLGGR